MVAPRCEQPATTSAGCAAVRALEAARLLCRFSGTAAGSRTAAYAAAAAAVILHAACTAATHHVKPWQARVNSQQQQQAATPAAAAAEVQHTSTGGACSSGGMQQPIQEQQQQQDPAALAAQVAVIQRQVQLQPLATAATTAVAATAVGCFSTTQHVQHARCRHGPHTGPAAAQHCPPARAGTCWSASNAWRQWCSDGSSGVCRT